MSHFHSESLRKCFTTFELFSSRSERDCAGSPCGRPYAARGPRASPLVCRLQGLEDTASRTPTLYTPRPSYPLRLAVAAAAVAEQEVRLTESLPRICRWPNQPDALMQCFRGVQGFHVSHTCTRHATLSSHHLLFQPSRVQGVQAPAQVMEPHAVLCFHGIQGFTSGNPASKAGLPSQPCKIFHLGK